MLLRKGHYRLIFARSGGALSLVETHYHGCLEFFPFLYWECFHSSGYSGNTLLFSNLVCCIVYFPILIPCIYEKTLSPTLLHILKPTKQRQLTSSDVFLFKFIVNLTQRTKIQQSVLDGLVWRY